MLKTILPFHKSGPHNTFRAKHIFTFKICHGFLNSHSDFQLAKIKSSPVLFSPLIQVRKPTDRFCKTRILMWQFSVAGGNGRRRNMKRAYPDLSLASSGLTDDTITKATVEWQCKHDPFPVLHATIVCRWKFIKLLKLTFLSPSVAVLLNVRSAP